MYQEKYQSVNEEGRVLLSNDLREQGTRILHRFNLFKRLESSVFSFGETIRRLMERIENYMNVLQKSAHSSTLSVEENDEDDFDTVLDYKYEVQVKHLNIPLFMQDLQYD